MGFSGGGVWVMGYGRPMGYGMHFPAHQVGGLAELWDITGYGFSQVWVITGSTVAWSQFRHRFTPGFERIIQKGVTAGWYDTT
jgi:hypothetical protein